MSPSSDTSHRIVASVADAALDPLNDLQAHVELLRHGRDVLPPEIVERLEETAQSMADLAERAADGTLGSVGTIERVDLHALVAAALDRAGVDATAVSVLVDDEEGSVVTDATVLTHAICSIAGEVFARTATSSLRVGVVGPRLRLSAASVPTDRSDAADVHDVLVRDTVGGTSFATRWVSTLAGFIVAKESADGALRVTLDVPADLAAHFALDAWGHRAEDGATEVASGT